jgi:hypothetical protein
MQNRRLVWTQRKASLWGWGHVRNRFFRTFLGSFWFCLLKNKTKRQTPLFFIRAEPSLIPPLLPLIFQPRRWVAPMMPLVMKMRPICLPLNFVIEDMASSEFAPRGPFVEAMLLLLGTRSAHLIVFGSGTSPFPLVLMRLFLVITLSAKSLVQLPELAVWCVMVLGAKVSNSRSRH